MASDWRQAGGLITALVETMKVGQSAASVDHTISRSGVRRFRHWAQPTWSDSSSEE